MLKARQKYKIFLIPSIWT